MTRRRQRCKRFKAKATPVSESTIAPHAVSDRQRLSPPAARFPGMHEANPTAPLLASAQGRERLLMQYPEGSWIDDNLLPFFRMAAVASIHDKAQASSARG